MKDLTPQQAIDSVIDTVIYSSTISTDYKCGNSIRLFLEHAVEILVPDTRIEDLWGPVWVLYLVKITDRLDPPVSKDIAIKGISEVVRCMSGHSEITPVMALAEKTGLLVDKVLKAVAMDDRTPKHQLRMATEICNNLHIPSYEEIVWMDDALGRIEDIPTLAKLYEEKPVKSKPISKDDIPAMLARMRFSDSNEAVKQTLAQAERSAVKYRQEITKMIEEAEEAMFAAMKAEREEMTAKLGMVQHERRIVQDAMDNNTAKLDMVLTELALLKSTHDTSDE